MISKASNSEKSIQERTESMRIYVYNPHIIGKTEHTWKIHNIDRTNEKRTFMLIMLLQPTDFRCKNDHLFLYRLLCISTFKVSFDNCTGVKLAPA